ncbi:MAG: VanZ family protein [Cyanobacteria bacterium]|nr:VanZ family protein [Cyanobacteriota bacterium]
MRTGCRILWALLGTFIVLGSMGTWAPNQPGIWAPTLIVIPDVATNVLLYVPFGALGVLSFRGAYRRHWLRLVMRITGVAILFSASNEALQLYTSDRVGSLTDIASASAGAFIGGMALSVWRSPK